MIYWFQAFAFKCNLYRYTLGAMSSTVQWQLEHWGAEGLVEGDVLVTNHPRTGGSHLPDITVVTPVFRGGEIVFLVASRGHHADVGGITPGSMPPFSRSIADEGAAIKAFKLVSGGTFQEEGIAALLTRPETGSPGTRKLADNLSDLKAQVAANQRGILLINELIDEYGLGEVQAYMGHVQDNAELAVRDMLREAAERLLLEQRGEGGGGVAGEGADVVSLTAEDKMDDGSVIKLRLTLDRRAGSAVFDFTGTSYEVYGNWNAPPAVTCAAVIYCVRCLVNQEIPLNQGCLKPIEIIVPDGTFLSPSENAAVVGGNVLTSQRVTDVCLAAFTACADSQGCMNNLTFGDDTFGYYETIAGGAGAGPGWDGASGVQCHMTNTRITDPEILERRYPVVGQLYALNAALDRQLESACLISTTLEPYSCAQK
jgi:5-oxoprolinase (ATP-hydrolysing)